MGHPVFCITSTRSLSTELTPPDLHIQYPLGIVFPADGAGGEVDVAVHQTLHPHLGVEEGRHTRHVIHVLATSIIQIVTLDFFK